MLKKTLFLGFIRQYGIKTTYRLPTTTHHDSTLKINLFFCISIFIYLMSHSITFFKSARNLSKRNMTIYVTKRSL